MLTKSDVNKLIEVFATKDELHIEISKVREEMATGQDKVLSKLDFVLTEVKDIRQEQQAHYSQHDRIDTRLDTLETRVDTIEQPA